MYKEVVLNLQVEGSIVVFLLECEGQGDQIYIRQISRKETKQERVSVPMLEISTCSSPIRNHEFLRSLGARPKAWA